MDLDPESPNSHPEDVQGTSEEVQDGNNETTTTPQQGGAKNSNSNSQVLLDQERFLPIANVVRLMKMQMDPQAKLAKDAKECVQECVSEFISFIASEAAEICNQTKRKTITADDLLTAMESTGFDNYAEPMRIFLMKYRQAHKITGPIHKNHPNYVRPKHFAEDGPLLPFFFDTEQGRRCTETQYVVNGSEVIKNAPLSDEWNEHTGTLNKIVDDPYGSAHVIKYDMVVPVEEVEEVVEEEVVVEEEYVEQPEVEEERPVTPIGAIALEQQGAMQIYVDPKSKQHYAAKETANGMELYPLTIQDTPVHLENVSDHTLFVLNLSDGTTGHAFIPTGSGSSGKAGFKGFPPAPIRIPYEDVMPVEEVEIDEEAVIHEAPPTSSRAARAAAKRAPPAKKTPQKRRK